MKTALLIVTALLLAPAVSAQELAGAPAVRFSFPRDQATGFREVHLQSVAGTWSVGAQGLVGSIPNDVSYSFMLAPQTVPRHNLSVSATFRFLSSVDYNAAGVGIVDPAATHAAQQVLHCDLSERENHVRLARGWQGTIAAQGLGRDVALNSAYTLTMEIQGTTVRCLVDGVPVVTAAVDLASLPDRVHPALQVLEAAAAFTELTVPAAGGPAAAGIRFTFPPDQPTGFREVHLQSVAGAWSVGAQGLAGAVPNDVSYSFFLAPATFARQSVTVSATFRFLASVDYNAAGVGIIDPAATHASQSVLHCDLSERENHVRLARGWQGTVAAQGVGLDVAPNTAYTLTLEVEGTTVRCLLDGQPVVTATVPELASFPAQVHPTMQVLEAHAGFTAFTAAPRGGIPVR